MTRVALTDPNRTRAMVAENRRNVADLLGSVIEELSFAKKMLEGSDGDSAVSGDEHAFFAKADSWREYKYEERVADDGNESAAALDLRELRFALDCACDWQSQLIQSAQSGEQIVGVSLSDSAVACDSVSGGAVTTGGAVTAGGAELCGAVACDSRAACITLRRVSTL